MYMYVYTCIYMHTFTATGLVVADFWVLYLSVGRRYNYTNIHI